MKYIFSLVILLSFVCTGGFAQNKKPGNNEVSFARQYAMEFLDAMGAGDFPVNLKLEEYTDHMLFFNDVNDNVFVLMARDDYADLLNEQVLAFSVGVPHGKARENETFMRIFYYYDKLIAEMKRGDVPREKGLAEEKVGVKPMLYSIRWTQQKMRNVYDGQTEPVVFGCGPVAVGQLMKYYRWPNIVRGKFAYKDDNKRLMSIDMDGAQINWDWIKDIYHSEVRDLDPLMTMLGKAMKVTYGNEKEGTSVWTMNIKRAMTMHFGYSPAMFLASNSEVDEANMIYLIREELKKGGPSILTGGRHLFVCDGMFKDFLHLNMGWRGSYDGWYRFPVVRKEINTHSFIESALLNIMPMEEKGISKTVNVEVPGTLPSMLSEDECLKVTSLKVNGKLNGADIALLRRLAGAVKSEHYTSWKGVLTSLDLSGATIMGDSVPYISIDAGKVGFRMSNGGKEYDFANMTDEDWNEFCKTGWNRNPAYDIVKSDSTYLLNYKTGRNVIGVAMFDGCENLQHIALPANTEVICMYALNSCRCLMDITIPSGVREMQNCFGDCPSLERIRICSDSPLVGQMNDVNKKEGNPVYRFAHPELRMEIDATLPSFKTTIERNIQERSESRKVVETAVKKDEKSVTTNSKVVSRHKIANGKKVIVGRKVVQ